MDLGDKNNHMGHKYNKKISNGLNTENDTKKSQISNRVDKKLTYLESILLVSDKPLSIEVITKTLNLKKRQVKELIKKLQEKFNKENSGIHLAIAGKKVQFTTNPTSEKITKNFIKEELNSNLTNASLETLTIIAYRGPITKSELEQIRGVNCSIILKNLMIKGLIENELNKEKMLEVYNVTLDFLKYLGINKVNSLPEYEKLNSDEIINKIINNEAENEQ